jgi:hypothetical protein
MAVLVSNDTYSRFVFDPEEGETRFGVDFEGKEEVVTVEELEESLKREGATLTRMFVIPKEDARKINVTFRPLRSFDKHAIQDLTSDDGSAALGSSRRLLIKRAVVRWDYDVPWSEAILDQLDAGIEEQIYGWISWGIEPPEQDPETGQRVLPLEEEPTPNRKERRARKSASSSQTTSEDEASVEPSEDDSTS